MTLLLEAPRSGRVKAKFTKKKLNKNLQRENLMRLKKYNKYLKH